MRSDTDENGDDSTEAAPQAASPQHQRGRGWLRQFVQFGLVGLSSTAVELALYNILLLIHRPQSNGLLVVYSTAGVVAAILNSYHWDRRWAFREGAAHGRRAVLRQRLLFLAQSGANIGINDGVVALVAPPLISGHALSAFAAANLAKVAGMFCASMFSFIVLRLVVFH